MWKAQVILRSALCLAMDFTFTPATCSVLLLSSILNRGIGPPNGGWLLLWRRIMAHFIVTGSYTASGMKGMMAHPSDREAAASSIIEAGGGKLKSFLVTTGDNDFLMIVETGDLSKMLASLMVVGASGAVTGLKTVQAFTSAEFTVAQKAAGVLATKYAPPA
jgi:uncharacterized protein with GYD domain